MTQSRLTRSHWQELISLLIVVAIASITVFAYFVSYYGWKIYLEILAHFQVQYFVLSLVLFGVLILLRRKKYIYSGLFLCVILSLQTVTWFWFPSHLFTADEQESDLKVLVANLNTQNTNYNLVLDLVRAENPDVAIFMEVDRRWQTQLDTLDDLLPYSSGKTNPYNLGILVYSDRPLNNAQVRFFNTENNPSVVTQLTILNRQVTLLATHPLPPVKPSFFHSRNRQMDSISQYLQEIDTPVILAGDLNLTMWSPYYRRLINKTGLNNTRKGFGILPSWATSGTYPQLPDWLIFALRIPIDHCLISRDFKTTNIYTGKETGSDHLPIIVDLKLISALANS